MASRWTLELASIPEHLCPGLERFDFARNSLLPNCGSSHTDLGRKLGSEEISAQIPSSEQRKLLTLADT